MMIRSIFMTGLVLCLTVMAMPVRAQTLNCDTISELQGNRRDRSIRDNQECILWSQSTEELKIYYPVAEGGDQDVAESDLRDVKQAVENSMNTYRVNGFLSVQEQPPIHLWIIRGFSTDNQITAIARVYNNSSPCVVNVYWGAVKNGELSPEKFKQDLAHELFHCVQYAQLDMYAGRTGVTAWWAEGSADWASGIVYPGVNGEQEWSPYYQQYKSLPDQCDPSWSSTCGGIYAVYATSLFFQDMANQKGNGAVFNLLQHIAVRSHSPQMRALADTADIDYVFEKFAQDFIDKKISDPGGGYMAQPDVKITDFLRVDETKDITVQGQPLMIYVYKINFDKGKTYALTGLANQDRFRLSYRMGDNPWISGEGSAPITIEAGCAAKTMTVAVSSAKDSSDVQDFTLHANVTDAEPICDACECARPVPACVIGHWVGDEAPQLDYFVQSLMNVQKAGKNKAVFEGGKVIVDNANLALDIQTGGSFNGSTDISYHGSGAMDGHKITMSGGIKSTGHGTSCLTQEGQLCLNVESVSPPVAMKITAMGMTIPFASRGGTYKGVVSMPFTCSPHSLILKPTVKGDAGIPTREMRVKFHR